MNIRCPTNILTAKELNAELVELETIASKGELTPLLATRMQEVKRALAHIRNAQRQF